jgi:signal transduction histidine kinase/HAMP domain-containing protein
MFSIRGKLLIYALEIVAASILLLSMPPQDRWVQVGFAALAVSAVVLAALMGHTIASAVDGLVAATRRIGEGNYDVSIPINTSDEISVLAREIERMRVLLREKVRQLEELNRDLERKVERRTEELRNANERLSLIHEVTNAVNSSLDFQRIFEAVVEGTRRLVDFEQASIARITDAQTATVFAISGNPGSLREGKRIAIPASRFSDVLERRQPAVFDVPLDRIGQDTLNMSAIRREIVLPLVVGDQVIGTFNLGSDRKDAFSAAEIEVLSQIASELGVALLQADSYEREHQAAQKLKELSDLKSEFVSKVSHELRTPLTSIMGAADNLLDGIAGVVGERPRAYLVRIKDNSDRLLRLINELLDLSRIEAGKEEIRVTRFRLDALIQETVETLKPLAEERGVALAAPQPPALTIRADRDKISRVLMNLLHNGIKFTPAGGRVEVAVSGDAEWVRVEVQDSGVGIPPGEIERVFDKFHQVKRSRSRGRPGSGLGLPISRQLVELHGGRLTAESTPGRGSTFRVVLPVSASPATSPGIRESHETWRAS